MPNAGVVLSVSPRSTAKTRCAYCHDELKDGPQTSCSRCRTLLHPVCRAVAGGCPTLGCERPVVPPREHIRLEPGQIRRRGNGRQRVSPRRRLARAVSAIVLPILAFGMSAAGFTQPLLPAFDSGSWEVWWQLAYARDVHLLCLPLVGWAMVSFALAEEGRRSPWINAGLLGGVLLSLIFSVLFLPLVPLSFVTIPFFGLGLLGLAPFWAFATYLAAYLRYPRAPLAPRLRPYAVWLAGGAVTAHQMWMKMSALHGTLPTQAPNCYLATVAARGNPRIVGSEPVAFADGATIPVSRQLRVFKVAELALRALAPTLHRGLRAVYDVIGPPLAARLGGRSATAMHCLLVPCQALAELGLKLVFRDPEALIDATYVGEGFTPSRPGRG